MNNKISTAIQNMAKLVLAHLPEVSDAARQQAKEARNRMAKLPSMISEGEDPHLVAGKSANLQRQIALLDPVIAQPFHVYVKAKHDGNDHVYLVMRYGIAPYQSFDGVTLCPYKRLGGSIAEEVIGEETEWGVIPLERNFLAPVYRPERGGWDGINNQFEAGEEYHAIPSLRDLPPFPSPPIPLPDLTESEKADPAIIARIKALEAQMSTEQKMAGNRQKVVIDSITLRDQAFLDAMQGRIFRMPIDSQFAVTGAPGTGKTTLLIKRLAQKTEISYLSDDEKEFVNIHNPEHQKWFTPDNWILFVPSAGLRGYLKEAMAHEQIPANSETVKVWSLHSEKIARDVFGYIGFGKALKYNEDATILAASSSADIMQCVAEFEAWHEAEIARVLQEAKSQAKKSGHDTALLSRLNAMQSGGAIDILRQAEVLRADFRQRGEILRQETNTLTHSALVFVPHIEEQVTEIFPPSETDNTREDESDDDGLDGAENQITGREGDLIRVQKIIRKTVRHYAGGAMGSGKAGEKTRRLWDVMEPTLMKRHQSSMPLLSELAVERKIVAPLAGGYRNYLNRIPGYYAQFRRHQLRHNAEGFFKAGIDAPKTLGSGEISPDEVDIVNFVMLKRAHELAGLAPDNAIVKAVANMQKTQIAADEATDFSSVQLGCMYYLAKPEFRSFTMVGDVMQRLTARGIQDFAECEAFAPNFTKYFVQKTYRQSRRLTELAAKMHKEFTGKEPSFESAYPEDAAEPELLLHCTADDTNTAEWIADRINEICDICKKLPSIAVFVPDGEQAQKMADILERAINKKHGALHVYPCLNGNVSDSSEGVHVIPVRFVKGLEFEGVFFVGLDDIANRQEQADLTECYLYVGVTRAAQFLAVVCRNTFPSRLSRIRDDFREGGTWG